MRLTTDPRLVSNVNATLVGHAQLRGPTKLSWRPSAG
jgi:hypothetical protein